MKKGRRFRLHKTKNIPRHFDFDRRRVQVGSILSYFLYGAMFVFPFAMVGTCFVYWRVNSILLRKLQPCMIVSALGE